MKFKPRPYQTEIINFVVDNKRCNVFASMGAGKSAASIEAFSVLKLLGEANRLLILAPKRVATGSWPDELVNWSESFGHLSIAVAVGTPAERMAALMSKSDIVAINYDTLEWLIEVWGPHWDFDMVVADEATRLKGTRVSIQTSKTGKQFLTGQGSSRGKALARVAHTRVTRWVNLTGSPAPNGVQDLWGIMYFVDMGRRLGSSFTAFSNRWFRQVPGTDGYSRIEPMPFSQSQIEDAIRDVSITIDARKFFNVKEPVEHIVKVKLPPKARKHYIEMEKELFTEINNFEVEVFSAGSKSNKCLQLANGAIYVDADGSWEPVHDEKIEALKSIVEETAGEPLLVAYQFKSDLARILKAFPKAKTLDSSKTIVADFNAGKVPMLVVHPASAGHGLSLQHGCHIMVDFSTGWNLEYDEQVIERIGPVRQSQSGYDRVVYRYRIVAEDTIEEFSVLPRLKTKASVQDSLKEALKKKKRMLNFFAFAKLERIEDMGLPDYAAMPTQQARVSNSTSFAPAPALLDAAARHMEDRAKTYDQPGGERSMGKTVAAFNIITGRNLSESEGWLLMQILKDVRDRQRTTPHIDSLEDCIAYSALKAEARISEQARD